VTHVTHTALATEEALLVLRSGDAIVNAVTGERILIRTTATESGGERFELERCLPPDGPPRLEHLHPQQESVITVVRGVCGLRLAGNIRVAVPGERLVIAAGVPHQLWNAGGDTLHLRVEKRPALESSEQLILALCNLAAAGQTDARGVPNLLQQAVMIPAYADAVRLATPPWPVQRALCAVVGPVARARGYRPLPERSAPVALTAPDIVPASRGPGGTDLPDVEAHITGTVWKVECEIGQQVEEGDTLVILESMKMEMPVEAEDEGIVKEIVCEEGQSVSEGDTLVVLE
jgi:acetyl-CoA carboxylase biotin carboxyl carrier protein